jgi:solute carrier family 25 citrate transporter 1
LIFKAAIKTGLVLSGLLSGITEAVMVVTPTETIKTKLIDDQNSSKPRFRNAVHGTKLIIAEQGIGGIYRGIGAVVARQGANSAVRMTTYSLIRSSLSKNNPIDKNGKPIVPWYYTFFSGGIAGTATVYATMVFIFNVAFRCRQNKIAVAQRT